MNEQLPLEEVDVPDEKQDGIKYVPTEGKLKASDLKDVYLEFKKPISHKGLQESDGGKTRKGYDTLGYGYAWLTERLNDVLCGHWRIVIDREEKKDIQSKKGNLLHEVEMDLTLQLGNWREYEEMTKVTLQSTKEEVEAITETTKSIKCRDFEVISEHPGFGWHKALSIADARKGAYTNGLKKAAGMFGIGNDAYKKYIDVENGEVKESLAKKKEKKKPEPLSPKIAEAKKALVAKGLDTEAKAISYLKANYGLDFSNLKNVSEAQAKLILFKLNS